MLQYRQKIENLFIILLMIVMSYQTVFSKNLTFLDEVLILIFSIIVFSFSVIKKENIDWKIYIYISTYIVITFIYFIIGNYNINMYFMEIINYIKVILLFEAVKLCKINDNRLKLLIKYFMIINILSIMVALYQYGRFQLIGYKVGDKLRNNKIRIEGLSGHPITLGMICSIMFFFVMSKIKNHKKNIIEIVICSILIITLVLTGSRFPMLICACMILYRFIFEIIKKYRIDSEQIKKVISVTAILCICIMIVFNNLIGNYIQKNKNSIRMYALIKVPEVIQKYPLFGTGIGTLSCRAAIKYNTNVYREFDFSDKMVDFATKNIGSGFESHLAKQLIETGIIGTILYYGYFVIILIKSLKCKNNDVTLFIGIVLLNSIINQIYSIPLILITTLLVSNMDYKSKADNNSNYLKV